MHEPLITLNVDETGDSITFHTTCPACDGGSFTVPTEHLELLTHTLIATCATIGIDLGRRPALLIDLGTSENRRAMEARYVADVREHRQQERRRAEASDVGQTPADDNDVDRAPTNDDDQ